MQHYLVTGATGYIGGKLAHALLQTGAVVHVVTRRSESMAALKEQGYHVHLYDGSYASLATIFSTHPIDVVLHLAAWSGYATPPAQLDHLLDANLRFGGHLLAGMAAHGCFKLVNTGSYWQHDDEETYRPYCLYAATKQAYEAMVDHYVMNEKLSAITLKLHDVYGKDDYRKKIFTQIDEAAVSGKVLSMSAGEQKLRLVDIEDVVAAYQGAIGCLVTDPAHQRKHQRYFVGGQAATLKDLISTYLRNTGKQVQIDWGSLPYRPNQIMAPFLGKTVPGWKITRDLTTIIGRIR
jgi:nucleoside-diphosphate-sugar epimerase